MISLILIRFELYHTITHSSLLYITVKFLFIWRLCLFYISDQFKIKSFFNKKNVIGSSQRKYLYSFQFKHSEFLLNTMSFDFISYSQYLTNFWSKWKLFSKRKYMVKFGYMRMGSFMCLVSFKQIFIIVLF